jgi:hypothetical protein
VFQGITSIKKYVGQILAFGSGRHFGIYFIVSRRLKHASQYVTGHAQYLSDRY